MNAIGLDSLAKTDPVINREFASKHIDTGNFAKKLLGQIVFLYFLQKKGWMGVAKDEAWGTGSRRFLRDLFEGKCGEYDNFFNDVLEHLFYDALAEKQDDDFYSDLGCKVPFLNGGLFEPIKDYDWRKTDIVLSNTLFSNQEGTKEGDIGSGILDVFDRYNFTVREDEPLEKEVAVDPEMLGKVFENLLEVKDRKSKGAFYTPREIVHYICQQSLINYLDATINLQGESIVPRDDIEFLIQKGELVIEHDVTSAWKALDDNYKGKYKNAHVPDPIRIHAAAIDDALVSVKICDPAIGSGAFPVGIMHEIVKARRVLTTYIDDTQNRTVCEFKRNAIQNSLYGVDIDPSAVDIAKLRLWLSLVVDENDYQDIRPLPNLGYKIVCGDSLLGVDRKNLFVDMQLSELEEKKKQFFDATHPQTKKKLQREINTLIVEITDGNRQFDFKVHFSEIWHNPMPLTKIDPPLLS